MTGERKHDQAGPRQISLPLALSIGVNLLLIGLIAGLWFQVRDVSQGPGGLRLEEGPGFTPGALMRHLPADDRAELRRWGRGLRAEFRDMQEDRRIAMRGVFEALAAEPYDPMAAEAAISALHDLESNRHREVQQRFLDIWNELDPQVRRQVIAEWRAERDRRVRLRDQPPPR